MSVLVRFGIRDAVPFARNAAIGKWRMSRKSFDSARASLDLFLGAIAEAGPDAARWAGRVVFEIAE